MLRRPYQGCPCRQHSAGALPCAPSNSSRSTCSRQAPPADARPVRSWPAPIAVEAVAQTATRAPRCRLRQTEAIPRSARPSGLLEHEGSRVGGRQSALALDGGCRINPRRSHSRSSKGGVENAESMRSSRARSTRPGHSSGLTESFQQVSSRIRQTSLCDSLDEVRASWPCIAARPLLGGSERPGVSGLARIVGGRVLRPAGPFGERPRGSGQRCPTSLPGRRARAGAQTTAFRLRRARA